MSKHQHGNKEAKKPKREPVPALAPALPIAGTPERTALLGNKPPKRK